MQRAEVGVDERLGEVVLGPGVDLTELFEVVVLLPGMALAARSAVVGPSS